MDDSARAWLGALLGLSGFGVLIGASWTGIPKDAATVLPLDVSRGQARSPSFSQVRAKEKLRAWRRFVPPRRRRSRSLLRYRVG